MASEEVEITEGQTMIIGKHNGNTNECESFQTPTKKRTKEGKKVKKSKKQKIIKEVIENIDTNNVPMEEATEELQEFASQKGKSPVFIPTLSSPEPESPESCVDTPTQSHANIDLVTFNQLNSNNVAKLRQERDRLQFGGLRIMLNLVHHCMI